MNADEIRLTVIKAIFSTPQLEEILTLKGGNAMKLQGLTDRQSQDLDFSIQENIRLSIEQDGPLFFQRLQNEFKPLGYQLASFKFDAGFVTTDKFLFAKISISSSSNQTQ